MLHIAQLAPIWVPVPPRTYGGIELMLSNLIDSLVERKYKITLFASADSKTKADLVPVVDQGLWLEHNIRNPHAPVMRMVKMVYDRLWDFDLIHNHFNFFTFPLSLRMDCPPMLTTVHRPVDQFYADTMASYRKVKYCALSEDHKKSIEDFGIPVLGVVPNGVDIEKYEFGSESAGYLLYLSRLNKEKGILTAIEVARAAKKNLIVAGNIVGGDEWLFFMREVQPALNGEYINFRGQVDFKSKIDLLKNADALIFPIERREPFGLVMIEAMACGTPVIAFSEGSVPEVVTNGLDGFVVKSKEEMIKAISKINKIDRRACREAVEKKFTTKIMGDKYEEIYAKLT